MSCWRSGGGSPSGDWRRTCGASCSTSCSSAWWCAGYPRCTPNTPRAAVANSDRSLGGYDPEAGLNIHEADRPTLIPVPSLLRSLLSDHLDPGYSAAAAKRANGGPPRSRWARWGWQAAAALLIAVVFAAAVAQARSVAPGVKETQKVLASSVRGSEDSAGQLAAQRAALAAEVDTVRRGQLADDALGQQLLRGLDALSFTAATTALIGPGLTVTLTDPGASSDLSDVS